MQKDYFFRNRYSIVFVCIDNLTRRKTDLIALAGISNGEVLVAQAKLVPLLAAISTGFQRWKSSQALEYAV